MALMARYPGKYFDLAITDPPYFEGPNKAGYYKEDLFSRSTGARITQYKTISEWQAPDNNYFNELCRVSRHQIIWGINYFQFSGVKSGRIVWDKKHPADIAYSDGEIAYCSLIKGVRFFRYRWHGMLHENMKNKEHRIHPTQKPVDLYKFLLSRYAKPGWRILDTHFGSGSIAIACIDMGFDLTASEINIQCYEAAMSRIKNHTAQGVLFSPSETNASNPEYLFEGDTK
jgi:site-specific DNA-methyltransferase (adenine-specific)